jgi:hypothetical protein
MALRTWGWRPRLFNGRPFQGREEIQSVEIRQMPLVQ